MDKFQDAYQDAAQKAMPPFRMSADRAKDELHHYEMKRQRRNYLIVRGCTAATVFLLCGVGTVAAKSYRDSIIRLNDTGVTITAQQMDVSDTISFFEQIGGVFSIADPGLDNVIEDAHELEVREYNSLEDFLAAENVTVAFPDKSLFGTEFVTENVSVVGDGTDVTVHLYNDECTFCMMQFDNREVESYSAAMSFGGQSANERSFTSSQGFSYVMFDTLDEEGQIISVTAVISVNGWDLTLTFRGFDREIIEKIINGIDLSIYFR